MTRRYRNPREGEIITLDGWELDEGENPLDLPIAYYAGGSNDNTSDDPEIASYGEVYLGEITDEELEGICWGGGNGDGAGSRIDNLDDPFADYSAEEIAEIERFFCGDADAKMIGDRKSGHGVYCGSGDGWGDANGNGRTVGLYRIGIYD